MYALKKEPLSEVNAILVPLKKVATVLLCFFKIIKSAV
jgi:hypothetical protein